MSQLSLKLQASRTFSGRLTEQDLGPVEVNLSEVENRVLERSQTTQTEANPYEENAVSLAARQMVMDMDARMLAEMMVERVRVRQNLESGGDSENEVENGQRLGDRAGGTRVEGESLRERDQQEDQETDSHRSPLIPSNVSAGDTVYIGQRGEGDAESELINIGTLAGPFRFGKDADSGDGEKDKEAPEKQQMTQSRRLRVRRRSTEDDHTEHQRILNLARDQVRAEMNLANIGIPEPATSTAVEPHFVSGLRRNSPDHYAVQYAYRFDLNRNVMERSLQIGCEVERLDDNNGIRVFLTYNMPDYELVMAGSSGDQASYIARMLQGLTFSALPAIDFPSYWIELMRFIAAPTTRWPSEFSRNGRLDASMVEHISRETFALILPNEEVRRILSTTIRVSSPR